MPLTFNSKPESIHALFEKWMNEFNVENLMDLYEPEAFIIERNGKIISGHNNIQKHLKQFLSFKPKIRINCLETSTSDDETVAVSEWMFTGARPNGDFVEGSGQSYDIIRRQPDKTWKIVVYNPWSLVP